MNSLSYFINVHAGMVFFITVGILVLALAGVLVLFVWLDKKMSMNNTVSTVLMAVSVFACMAAVFLLGSMFKDAHDKGGARQLFVLPTEDGLRLAVWCTCFFPKKSGTDYTQYIRTFDLNSGDMLGEINIDAKYSSDDYRLYWSGGNTAWGYRKAPGVMLIDLVRPKIIADQTQLLKHDPHLGRGFRFEAYRDTYVPEQSGLYVRSTDGRFYKINPDLTTMAVKDLPEDVDLKQDWTFAKEWSFHEVPDSQGKRARNHTFNGDMKNSAILLKPQYLPELNHNVTQKKKTWVVHQSAMIGAFDILMSYVDGRGQALNTITISEHFPAKDVKVLSTYTSGREVYVFIGAGDTFRSSILGFSLSALQTDSETGALIKTIHFF